MSELVYCTVTGDSQTLIDINQVSALYFLIVLINLPIYFCQIVFILLSTVASLIHFIPDDRLWVADEVIQNIFIQFTQMISSHLLQSLVS